MTSAPGDATWIVSYAPTSQHCRVPPDAKPVFEVAGGGAVLAVVYQRPPR